MNGNGAAGDTGLVHLVTFRVCGQLCALDIADVDEIKRAFHITRVHRAPPQVSGVVNIRGQIVTVIDLRRLLFSEGAFVTTRSAMVIVRKETEPVGLLVDAIEDTVAVRACDGERTPTTVDETFGKFLAGVYKTDDGLIAVLNRTNVLERGRTEAAA